MKITVKKKPDVDAGWYVYQPNYKAFYPNPLTSPFNYEGAGETAEKAVENLKSRLVRLEVISQEDADKLEIV